MKTYKGTTNELTQIKLPSSIEQVSWTRRQAAPGGAVGLEVHTHYVGNGSDLQIELLDGQGKKHGTFKDQLSGNRFWAPIKVPAKASNALVATVKLPKHGLEKSSPALMLLPTIELRNAAWSAEEARRGDVLTLSAEAKGAPDGTRGEISIWEHDADGAHDLVTRLPVVVQGERVEVEWEFEYVEDTDDIPTDEEVEQGYQAPEYFFRLDVGGVAVESELLGFKDWVEFLIQHPDGTARADVESVIFIMPDGSEKRLKPNAAGVIRVGDASPGVVRIKEYIFKATV